MTQETSGWFDEAQRNGAPSAKFESINDSVYGEVVDQYVIDYIPFGKTEVAKDEKTGQNIKQLVLILQTDQRGWAGVSKIPTNEDGSMKDVSLDDGRRAIYARKFTNIYSAIGKAVGEVGAKDVLNGGKLGVQFFQTEDTGKGNPLKKFRAKYTAPVVSASSDFFGGDSAPANQPPQQQALAQGSSFGGGDHGLNAPQQQSAPPAQSVPANDPWATTPSNDEPPF